MHRNHDDGAAAPGPGAAELNPEMRTPGESGQAHAGNERADAADSDADDGAAQIDAKAIATAVARAAMAGVPVYRLMDGSFLAVWGVTRILPDLEAVEAFLRRVGGAT